MIIPLFQKIGQSSHRLARQVGEQCGEPATHTGTLDPMAEGVLIVLTGEDRFKKTEYSQWKKVYQFQVLLGISTDSYDLLGLVTEAKSDFKIASLRQWAEQVKQVLPRLIGDQHQVTPPFSAKRTNGESFFDLAKRGEAVPVVTQSITIHNLIMDDNEQNETSFWSMSSEQLWQHLREKISLVEGDFRQEQCLASWQALLLNNLGKQWGILYLEATVSHRTYIRSLVNRLGQLIGIPCTTFAIKRIQNGIYDSKTAREI